MQEHRFTGLAYRLRQILRLYDDNTAGGMGIDGLSRDGSGCNNRERCPAKAPGESAV
jgi:hypothetical protein